MIDEIFGVLEILGSPTTFGLISESGRINTRGVVRYLLISLLVLLPAITDLLSVTLFGEPFVFKLPFGEVVVLTSFILGLLLLAIITIILLFWLLLGVIKSAFRKKRF